MRTMCLLAPFAAAALLCTPATFAGEDGEFPCPLPDRITPTHWEIKFGQAGDSIGPIHLSQDGRYLAFTSYANVFVPGVAGTSEGGHRQVYLYDRQTDSFELISVGINPEEMLGANGYLSAEYISMSPNGRYVAYQSVATNLTEHPVSGAYTHIFVRDRELGQTLLASVSSEGEPANAIATGRIGVSDNGRVVFGSPATNLAPGHSGNQWQVYMHDLNTGETEIVSLDTKSEPTQVACIDPTISGDGSVVIFSAGGAVIPGPFNNFFNLYARDLSQNTTEMLSVDDFGMDRYGVVNDSAISYDGRFVIMKVDCFVPLDPEAEGSWNLYLRDREAQTTRAMIVGVNTDPIDQPESQFPIDISADGRYIVWNSRSELIAGESFGQRQLYRTDTTTREHVRMTRDFKCNPIQWDLDGLHGSISGDGRTVAFITAYPMRPEEVDGEPHIYLLSPDGAACAGDFNGDGRLTAEDFTAFRAAYLEGSMAADYNGNGALDVGDFTAFRNAYLAGCP